MALKKQVSILKISAMYIGAVIGAGFASGQEILQFFIAHGRDGIKEMMLVTFLFCYLGAIILYLSKKLNTNNYLLLVNYLVGKRVAKLIDILSLLMLAGGLSVMLSGSGAVFNEHFNIPAWYGISLIAGINCLILLCGMQGVLWVNVILVPLKITAILVTSLLLMHLQNNSVAVEIAIQQTDNVYRHWIVSGLLYVSYNMILVIAVLSTIGRDINTKNAIAGGILGGLGLGITAGVMFLAGLIVYPEITNYKVPMIYMAGIIGSGLKSIMGLLIWLAILTTTVANAHGFASRLAEPGSNKYKIIGILVTLLAIPLARLDFDKLVGIIYPIFGYAGLLLIIILLVVTPLKFLQFNSRGIN